MSTISLSDLSLDDLRQLEVDIQGERSRRSGEPILIQDRDIDMPIPSGGALLHVMWAVADQSYSLWFPSEAAAMAELHSIAARHKRVVEGHCVDLTASGCITSKAVVEVHN